MVWTNLFGVVSFELYGQLHEVVGEDPGDRDAFFAECVRRWICLRFEATVSSGAVLSTNGLGLPRRGCRCLPTRARVPGCVPPTSML
jgi:hypothetical protein